MSRLTKVAPAIILMFSLFMAACHEEEKPFEIGSLKYKGVAPIITSIDSSAVAGIPALKKTILLRYPILGDTLDVSILEFESDVYALDYFLNSGRFQGSTPILRGNLLQQSIRADKRIVIFKHDCFRNYERADLENYVKLFPGYHGGFPQAYLSMPFEGREPGRTSIQTKYFMGVSATFPVLVQSYRDANLRWNIARSWDQESPEAFGKWADALKKATPKGIIASNDCFYFDAGDGANGIASQLPGGRIVVVWGFLSWPDLERKFFTASDRIFGSRY